MSSFHGAEGKPARALLSKCLVRTQLSALTHKLSSGMTGRGGLADVATIFKWSWASNVGSHSGASYNHRKEAPPLGLTPLLQLGPSLALREPRVPGLPEQPQSPYIRPGFCPHLILQGSKEGKLGPQRVSPQGTPTQRGGPPSSTLDRPDVVRLSQ